MSIDSMRYLHVQNSWLISWVQRSISINISILHRQFQASIFIIISKDMLDLLKSFLIVKLDALHSRDTKCLTPSQIDCAKLITILWVSCLAILILKAINLSTKFMLVLPVIYYEVTLADIIRNICNIALTANKHSTVQIIVHKWL